ncbi:two component transcriptional regulator [Oscillochloris trichoides DG-6]|uniref:Two component transcriptional regulator n=1 Tax=Oscillochloris trichoides DG-6 TaxID=765420 RepID=E1IF93_9CHLR|nr:response regulator transcription factor [Oscillochloris trichoides]EFO80133.1 two component transcriptional regulator [Oscillochloris trichoides DG-6]
MQRLLIVDDEPAIVTVIRERLEREGLHVQTVGSGEAALHLLNQQPIDLVLLDVGLPDIDGFEVLRRLRAHDLDTPVLLLTARGDEIDRVVGLELGADDYVVKPFSVRELVARARALLRRATLRTRPAEPSVPPSPLQIDQPRRRATFQNHMLDLRPREFDLLAFLARHPGQVFSRDTLLRQVWGQDGFLDERTVDVHVRRLRAKLAEVDPEADLIQTEWGIGYRFAEA